MLAGTKTIFLAKPLKTQAQVDEAFGTFSRSTLLFPSGYGAGYLVTLSCSVGCFDQNATQRLQGEAIARRSLWGMMIK
jgi:hypothetical protein